MKATKRKVKKARNCGGKKCGSNWAGATELKTKIRIAA
jgi:hypothetical protein